MPEPCEVVIEVPAWTFVKRRPDGSVDFVSPLPSPFNYGSIVGTVGPDGDPLDALVLGPRLEAGTRVRTTAYAEVDFVDAGVPDPKRVCGRPLSAIDRARVISFFVVYARFKRALHRLRGARGLTAYRRLRSL
ncbi:MAG: inorganic diphosphatase [Sandaracinaceae bacterium]